MLRLIAIIKCKYGGNLPVDAKVLLAIPNIGKEMISVVLNSMGYYGCIQIGPEVDMHVSRNYLSNRVVQISKYIPVHPGIDAK